MYASNEVLQRDIIVLLEQSSFIFIMINEATDMSIRLSLILHRRFYYVLSCKFETKFIRLSEIERKTGEKYIQLCERFFEANGVPKEKVILLGSDGAKNMLGDHIV